ncbi:Dihydrofolate synthase @ Folylpolyglutamate synthase [uncultured Leptolyngbya sp.]|uniref:tetrahydrofolate synthase n=1 Tax=uncultured Leptolyngbya sp. TaxID=332963 RepID=A0A6J4KWB7_9CYAN|nr:Dihydrofolate synthase @ Folylpolyglutamate synthase [uncultured Leptolyngbya sp.]
MNRRDTEILDIDATLQTFARFGVRLGLESIQQLLAALGNPQKQVPIVHVAGSNGKGSVCAYLSAVLTEAGYRVGRYTSPHLIRWQERICLNEQPIATSELEHVLQQVIAAARSLEPSPTQFEVFTAAAWLYFAQQHVDIAVMEVGLGGRLDATNVCDRPLVSVIASISREHWQRLGPTLADIAWEKAGILKQGGVAVIGQLPPEAAAVVHRRTAELECLTVYPQPAKDLGDGWAEYQGIEEYDIQPESPDSEAEGVIILKTLKYRSPLLGDIQRHNAALAIATLQMLRQQGWQLTDETIANGIAKTKWPGRLQWFTWQGHNILIDGAHNPASAEVLRQFVDSPAIATNRSTSIHWVMGMLSTKDHAEVFQALLRGGDRLYLVPVPDHSTADPEALAALAHEICPDLATCQTYADVLSALEAATGNGSPDQAGAPNQPQTDKPLTVLCGSLYLIGHFFQMSESQGGELDRDASIGKP